MKEKRSIREFHDVILTNKWAAFPIFLFILFVVFECTFILGAYPQRWIDSLVTLLKNWLWVKMNGGWFCEMIVNGIIGGMGSLLTFLPNFLILYFFIELLDHSGYMARMAYVNDGFMRSIGLNGYSFIPMVMGFGCNVPAVMACSTIPNKKNRIITTLVLPFMSCSGRLPVYMIIIGAFFAQKGGLVLLGIYVLGIIVSIITAKIISLFITDDTEHHRPELPPLVIPHIGMALKHTWEKCLEYLRNVATTILVSSVVIWALGYFPNQNKYEDYRQKQEHSFLGMIGNAVEPALRPMGFDWKMNVGILSGICAKELTVSTMGVLYSNEEVSADSEENSTSLQAALAQTTTPATGIAFMVFVLLYFPCIATFVTIRKASGWKWAIITAIYSVIIAWVLSFAAFSLFNAIL